MIALLRRATKLPSDPDPALAGIGLAVLGKLAIEAGDQPWSRSNIMRCMSLNPGAMAGLAELSRYVLFGGSRLTRVQEEAIITTVANVNQCFY